VKNLGLQRGPILLDENAPIIQYLTKSYKKVMGNEPVHSGYVAYTDAAVVSLMTGNETSICFGPGNLEQGHTLDEWAYVEEIEKCADIFFELALSE
jgi:succinyl-diaminopimelate desuccinylase